MNLQEDYIKYYLEKELAQSPSKVIRSCLLILLVFCLPTALFGVYSTFTRMIMIPIITGFMIWSVLLLKKSKKQHEQFELFYGLFFLFFSLSCLAAAYKLISTTMAASVYVVIFVLVIFIICVITDFLIVTGLIKKGYYRSQKKSQNYNGLVSIIPILGILFGRPIFSHIEQDMALEIVASLLIFMGFYSAFGTTSLLKYYFKKKM